MVDFKEFGPRIGLAPKRVEKALEPFVLRQVLVESLINRPFWGDSEKRGYLIHYNTKRNYLCGN